MVGSRRGRCLAALLFAALPALAGCPPEPTFFPFSTLALPTGTVDSVRVRPGTIFAEAGTQFRLQAVAKGYLGMQVAVGASVGLPVEWTSSVPGVLNPSGSAVLVTTPQAPGTSFTIDAKVVSTGSGAGGVGIPSNTVTVHVTSKPSAAALQADDSDWIQVEHISGNPPAAAMLQGAQGGATLTDWTFGVVGLAELEKNVEPPAGTQGELAVFARDRAMALWPPDGPGLCQTNPAACPWTTGVDYLAADPLGAPGFRNLILQAAVPDTNQYIAGLPVATWAGGAGKQAFDVYNGLRIGLDMTWYGTFEHSLRDPETDEPAPAENPAAVCGDIDSILAPAHSVRQAVPTLFIVFVTEILAPSGPGGALAPITGHTCKPAADWTGRVVLISLADYNVTTLIHEIGHVLSHNSTYLASAGGHTNGRPGFDIGNIMHNTDVLPYRSARRHLTVGQLYRMNAHPASWLNTFLTTNVKTRNCSTSLGRGTCPALAADLGG